MNVTSQKKNFLSRLLDRELVVRTGEGKHLFTFDGKKRSIKIRLRGADYEIPVWQLEEFLRTSQRSTMTVFQDYDKLPCGHDAGTVLNKDQQWVCTECGQ